MYQETRAIFIYAVSPVHMGAGTAVGLIDNPIQRERHMGYPMLAGSGLKGAVRHRFWTQMNGSENNGNLLNRLFGPEAGESNLYAGAVSFGDAHIVAFPVRCANRAYVYATSPTALARASRLLNALGVDIDWAIPEVEEGFCQVIDSGGPVSDGQALHLEAFQYTAIAGLKLAAIADFLSDKGLPEGAAYDFFRRKLKTDLLVLPDDDFGYFVNNATVVEPHVRINNDTGTAEEGGLFYTENLPPESLLMAPLLVSAERSGNGGMKAQEVMTTVLDGDDGFIGLHGAIAQIGGDATTGRGQVVITAVGA